MISSIQSVLHFGSLSTSFMHSGGWLGRQSTAAIARSRMFVTPPSWSHWMVVRLKASRVSRAARARTETGTHRGDPKTLVFVAGQLSVGDNGEVVGKGDFVRQFDQVFSNLGGVLGGIGADYSAVVKFTTFLVEPDDIDTFMKLRAALFPKLYRGMVYPPNTLLIVKRLVKAEFFLEVEAVVSLAK